MTFPRTTIATVPIHSTQRLRDLVMIGQRWRRRSDGTVVRIQQVHRAERTVETFEAIDAIAVAIDAIAVAPVRQVVPFAELRYGYDLLVSVERLR